MSLDNRENLSQNLLYLQWTRRGCWLGGWLCEYGEVFLAMLRLRLLSAFRLFSSKLVDPLLTINPTSLICSEFTSSYNTLLSGLGDFRLFWLHSVSECASNHNNNYTQKQISSSWEVERNAAVPFAEMGNWHQGCAAVTAMPALCASCQGVFLTNYLVYWQEVKYRCDTQNLAQGGKFTQEAEAAASHTSCPSRAN